MVSQRAQVLLIDDDPAIGRLVANLLARLDVDVLTEREVAPALEQVRGVMPDLVLLDLRLQASDGIDFIEQFAKLKAPAPVLLLSGLDRRVLKSAGDIARALRLKVVGELSKTHLAERLPRLVAEAIGKPAKSALEALRDSVTEQQGRIVPFYQPIVELSSGRIVGAEALARWEHPVRGLLGPAEFIPLAEQHRLIDTLSLAMVEALLDHRTRPGFHDLEFLSFNVSGVLLKDRDFLDRLRASLGTLGDDGPPIEVEITETSAMEDAETALSAMSHLRVAGVGLAIDDYGIGHSTLARLQKLPFSKLKIDRMFIHNLVTDEESQAIVRSTMALSKSLGIQVVAEGVERQETLDKLAALGVDYAQGFLVGMPMPADEFAHFSRVPANPPADELPNPGA